MTPLFPWREAWTWDDGNPGKRPCILLMLNIFHDLPYVPTTFDEDSTWIPISTYQISQRKKETYRPQRRRKTKRGDFRKLEIFPTRNDKNSCKTKHAKKTSNNFKKGLTDTKNLRGTRRISEEQEESERNEIHTPRISEKQDSLIQESCRRPELTKRNRLVWKK